MTTVAATAKGEGNFAPSAMPRGRALALDSALLTFALAVAALQAFRAVHDSGGLDEDAAMVLRYVKNIATGYGVVWNPGGAHIDGATDFLFMWVVAGFTKLGLDAVAAAAMVSSASHVLTVFVIFRSSRRYCPQSRACALVASGFVAFGAARVYIATGFGTAFFAAIGSINWYYACRLVEEGRRSHARWFALGTLCLLLARPEGAILGGLMFIAVVIRRGVNAIRQELIEWLLIVTLGGVCFLAWRLFYFRSFLPLPLVRKGLGPHFSSFVSSWQHGVELLFPFLPVLGSMFIRRTARRHAIALSIVVGGFLAAWSCVSDAQNVFGRFQYPVLPIVMVSLPSALSKSVMLPLSRRRLIADVVVGLCLAGWCAFYWNQFLSVKSLVQVPRYEGTRSVAGVLRPLRDRKYRIATSEAGILPLYSDWIALDTWGLNDPWIAAHGTISFQYLEQFDPDVIMFNRNPQGMNMPEPELDRAWLAMTDVLSSYARHRGYLLVAQFAEDASGRTADFYYVRSTLPEAEALGRRISETPYGYWGVPWKNLHKTERPSLGSQREE